MIPSLIKLLESQDEDIRRKSLELIDGLTNRGEWKFDNIAAQLTRMTKWNIMKLSHTGFHRSLNYLKVGTRTFGRKFLS